MAYGEDHVWVDTESGTYGTGAFNIKFLTPDQVPADFGEWSDEDRSKYAREHGY